MFTFIGPILIAVNPYQSLPIFTKEFIKLYYDQVQFMPRFSVLANSDIGHSVLAQSFSRRTATRSPIKRTCRC